MTVFILYFFFLALIWKVVFLRSFRSFNAWDYSEGVRLAPLHLIWLGIFVHLVLYWREHARLDITINFHEIFQYNTAILMRSLGLKMVVTSRVQPS